MGVLAAVFALAGAGFNLFQPIIKLPGGQNIFSRAIKISIVDILRMIVSNTNEFSRLNWKLFAEVFEEAFRYAQPEEIIRLFVGLAIFITPVLAAIGAIQAASRKGGSFLLGLCTAVCGANFFFLNSSMGGLSYEVRQVVETISSPQIFLLWSVLYGVAMFCALFISDDKVVNVKERETVYVPKPHQAERDSLLNHLVNKVNTLSDRMNTQVSDVHVNEPAQVPIYEPILGLDTDALIKRAMLFLEDGEFDNAGRYIEQALNQDAENPRVHFAKLMLERKVHNVEELIEKSKTPLENEKLFQRALRFADGEYKTQLEGLAQASRNKIAQAQAEREAEQRRIQAEQEAEKEKRYQEILKLKETASENTDFQELLSKINSLRPYKDTDNLYNEVYQAQKVEKNYQNAIHMIQTAKSSGDFERLINILQSLGNYKEAEDWLEKTKKSQEEAKAKEKKRLKLIIGTVSMIVFAVLAWGGIRSYQDRAERLAQEKAIEEARIAREQAEERERQARIAQEEAQKKLRQDAMTAFFAEKPDAEKLIKNILGYSQNPVLSRMLLYLDYDNVKMNYVDLASAIEKSASLESSYREFEPITNQYNTKAVNRFLGDYYGNGNRTDKRTALLKFNSPAESGDKYSQFRMAHIYNALGDKANAAKWYRTLADNGTPNEKTKIGNIFYKGEDITQDYKQAYELYSQAAASGDAEAQNNIGWFYQRGFYVDKDDKNAFEWYLKAAEQGMAVSQEAVGYSYVTGRGVKQDFSQAVNWYTKAANQGREYSQYRLGELYMEGKGVNQNYYKALEWFRKAADKNNAPAMDKIGWFYQNGWGVNQDYNQAMQWYRKAAEQNNANAQASIGFLYYSGLGVTKDLNAALEWYKKSAAQGNDIAQKQVNLIELRLHGEQTRRNVNTSDFPLPAIIAGNKVGVRESSYQSARIKNVLNTGHPVSVSRQSYLNDGEYYYVRTASGTEGWVKGDYLVFKEANLTYQEHQNRRVSLPASGRVATTYGDALNVRNIPSVKGSKVVDKIDNGFYIERVLEIFATEDVDWYHVQYIKGGWVEGWVSGKYIQVSQSGYSSITPSTREIDVFELARTGTPEQMREAVRNGANFNVSISASDIADIPNAPDLMFDYGNTPLHYAASYNKNPEVISFLISQGLDVNAEASMGAFSGTPLSCAIENKNSTAIVELLRGGANPNLWTSGGDSLHILATKYSTNNDYQIAENIIVPALIEAGANVNSHSELTEQEIREIEQYEEDFARYHSMFIPRNQWTSNIPSQNMRDFSNATKGGLLSTLTPLMYAVLSDNPGIVNILLDNGANPNIHSADGKTAWDYARELPNNARLRTWEAFERLGNATS